MMRILFVILTMVVIISCVNANQEITCYDKDGKQVTAKFTNDSYQAGKFIDNICKK